MGSVGGSHCGVGWSHGGAGGSFCLDLGLPRVQDRIDILLLPQFTDQATYITSLIALTDFRIDKNLLQRSLNSVT